MNNADETSVKTHYICQTYLEKPAKGGGPAGLKVDKQFQYSTADQAQNRAEREAQSDNCAGADAYMVVEDTNSGEVGAPSFLVRLGRVPDFEDF